MYAFKCIYCVCISHKREAYKMMYFDLSNNLNLHIIDRKIDKAFKERIEILLSLLRSSSSFKSWYIKNPLLFLQFTPSHTQKLLLMMMMKILYLMMSCFREIEERERERKRKSTRSARERERKCRVSSFSSSLMSFSLPCRIVVFLFCFCFKKYKLWWRLISLLFLSLSLSLYKSSMKKSFLFQKFS